MTVLYHILGLIVFIIVLMVIVAIHEAGHLFVAKKSGILCHEYSIGMGPLIAQKKAGETMVSFRAIPIGGYVSMAGEDVDDDILKEFKKVKLIIENDVVIKIIGNIDNPKYADLPTYDIVSYDIIGTAEAKPNELFIVVKEEDSEEELRYNVARDCMVNYKKNEEIQIAPYDRTFNHKSWGKRFLSVLAGPVMNFIFAWFIFLLMGIIFGYADTSTTRVDKVSDAALAAGLKDNDVIYSINGTVLDDWNSLSAVMGEIAKGKNQSNGNSGINADGSVNVKYYYQGNTDDLREVVIYPTIYIISSDLMIEYKDGNVVIANETKDTKLEKAGLNKGDVIKSLAAGDVYYSVSGVNDVLKFYDEQIGNSTKEVKVRVNDSDDDHTINIYTLSDLDANNLPTVKVLLGVATASKFQLVKLLYVPFVQTGESSGQIIKTLRQLFSRNSSISIRDMSGPVGIYNLFTRLVQGEDAFYNILYYTGLISVNLGIINLLPLPALDGGRIALLFYEGITKRKPTPKVENIINTVGLVLLLGFAAFIFISDIIKLF